jgi:hypothetical protein
VLVAAAALVALTVTGLAVALDSSSVQTPQPVGTSTSSTTSATTYPTSSSTAPTTETAVDEQPPQKPEKRGNGHGKKKGAD